MSLLTPVVILLFNRPSLTEIVFDSIRKAKPKKLLVVADGPRFPEEEEKCQKARAVIEKVDWDCNVLTNYSEENLGCKRRVSSGLNWVFSEVEEAIIVEDDCLPTPSFFYFCQTLLKYYRHDQRIMHIASNNFQFNQSRTPYSYYFSKYSHIWGWATWRRAWQYYDVEMKTWPEYQKLDLLSSVCEDTYEQKYWLNSFNQVFDGSIDTWDLQWLYTCWCQSGLSIHPNSTLVSNIGFGVDATHTFCDSPLAQLPTTDIWEIKHPPLMFRHREADAHAFDYVFGGVTMKKNDSWISKIRSKGAAIKRKFSRGV